MGTAATPFFAGARRPVGTRTHDSRGVARGNATNAKGQPRTVGPESWWPRAESKNRYRRRRSLLPLPSSFEGYTRGYTQLTIGW
jgi:hypothetical protein